MTDTTTTRYVFDHPPADRAEAVFQALGAASACWEHLNRAGVFDSTRAKAVGDALLDELGRLDEPLLGLATTRELLRELGARLAGPPSIGVRDDRPDVVRLASDLIETLRSRLPGDVLLYRTVDEPRGCT